MLKLFKAGAAQVELEIGLPDPAAGEGAYPLHADPQIGIVLKELARIRHDVELAVISPREIHESSIDIGAGHVSLPGLHVARGIADGRKSVRHAA